MRVVVTGASGAIGQAVFQRLLDEGIETVGIDKKQSSAGFRPLIMDLCDLGHVYTALAGADAVIHLGAIPSPFDAPADCIYKNNVMAQFNIFEAAVHLNIQRIVNISSVSALGFPFQICRAEPSYFPIDEQHPLVPQDPYGLSKATGEEIASAYCRRGLGSVVSLRPSTVVAPGNLTRYHNIIDAVRSDPSCGINDLWSYVDMRDLVDACMLALTGEFVGHHACFITAADTTSDLPTDELLDQWYPNVPRRSGIRSDRWSLLDGAKAERLLGYRARYSWHDVLKPSTRK